MQASATGHRALGPAERHGTEALHSGVVYYVVIWRSWVEIRPSELRKKDRTAYKN
jgi:hypothetical protein